MPMLNAACALACETQYIVIVSAARTSAPRLGARVALARPAERLVHAARGAAAAVRVLRLDSQCGSAARR